MRLSDRLLPARRQRRRLDDLRAVTLTALALLLGFGEGTERL